MSKTKLDEKKFSPLFGDWWKQIRPFFIKGGFDEIYKFLKEESKKGVKIAPLSCNTYRVFSETPFSELKAVIVLQDPYFTFKDGLPVADGVALSCCITEKPQPSLLKFYGGIETELFNGLNLDYIDTYDLSYLSKQGVLLLNTALTVEKDKAGSHIKIWEPFTKYLFKEVIGPTKVPVLFLGKEAGKYEPLVCLSNPTFTTKHPASASYTGGSWATEGAFTWLNAHIFDISDDTVSWLNVDPPF